MTSMDVIAECMLRIKESICGIGYNMQELKQCRRCMEEMIVEMRILNDQLRQSKNLDNQ
ncbi:MAG: hypothetical protein IKW08_04130 [Roseburia sp.]|nr:hypothetical protein [Roseburia sp.]